MRNRIGAFAEFARTRLNGPNRGRNKAVYFVCEAGESGKKLDPRLKRGSTIAPRRNQELYGSLMNLLVTTIKATMERT